MASRHLCRAIAIQSLYEWDFRGFEDKKLKDIVKRNFEELTGDTDGRDFTLALIDGVLKFKAGMVESREHLFDIRIFILHFSRFLISSYNLAADFPAKSSSFAFR